MVEFIYKKKSMVPEENSWGGVAEFREDPDGSCWKEMISGEYETQRDSGDVVVTLTKEEAESKFHIGYGGTNGRPFTAWTKDRVYFPVCYDGAEWVESVPRNFPGSVTEHVGG